MKRVLWCAVAAAAAAALGLSLHAGWHWYEVHTGIARGGPDPYYNAWSGILSDLGEYAIAAAAISGVIGWYRKHNCHEATCWRLGKHPTEGGTFILCHRHHPATMGAPGRHLSLEAIHAHHFAALARRTPAPTDTEESP